MSCSQNRKFSTALSGKYVEVLSNKSYEVIEKRLTGLENKILMQTF